MAVPLERQDLDEQALEEQKVRRDRGRVLIIAAGAIVVAAIGAAVAARVLRTKASNPSPKPPGSIDWKLSVLAGNTIQLFPKLYV